MLATNLVLRTLFAPDCRKVTVERRIRAAALRAAGDVTEWPAPIDMSELALASDTEAADARRDLDRLLERLPQTQRTLVLRWKLDGASLTELARASGMTETAVKVAVRRALRKLAAWIRDSDEDR